MSGPTTRVRNLKFSSGPGKLTTTFVNGDGVTEIVTSQNPGWELTGTQNTVSSGNPWYNRNYRRGYRGDIGGDFYTERRYVEGLERARRRFTTNLMKSGKPWTYIYDGPVLPISPNNSLFPPRLNGSNSVLNALGATAVARCKPTNSPADAATMLGELFKEGLPNLVGSTLWKERSRPARAAGSEYLNVEFGWKPLVNDLTKFLSAVDRADAAVSQYERDAGRVVRRSYRFPTQRTVTESTGALSTAVLAPDASDLYNLADRGTVVIRRESQIDRWFSGAFTYHLPTGYDSRNGMERNALLAREILGLDLTPEVLWNLAPWSWAVDWFSNTGDVISNMSDWATDGLVMRYGYIMEHTINRVTYSNPKTGLKNSGVRVPTLSFVTETKTRRRANPFGFGLSDTDLSPRQLTIAAALGLSRT